MTVGLLLPSALLALATLAIPLLLHLVRRQQLRPLDFAALRWLQALPRTQRRLRWNDLPLLLLRLLLLTLLALWLATPVLRNAESHAPYVAVMPGVPVSTAQQQSLPRDAHLHWLAIGFPAFDTATPEQPQPTFSLLRQLDAELPADVRLIVLATSEFDGADGQRLMLSRQLDWRIVSKAPPTAAAGLLQKPPMLHVYADAQHNASQRYLRAASWAWFGNAQNYREQTDFQTPSRQHTAVVWLQQTPLPPALLTWVRSGGSVLMSADTPLPKGWRATPHWRNRDGVVLMETGAFGKGRILRWTRALQPNSMPELLDADFPQQLQVALSPQAAPPQRVNATEIAPLLHKGERLQSTENLQPWLGLLIALFFALERWLATRQRVEVCT